MRCNRIGDRPTFHDQIDPTPERDVPVMTGREMIEQLHPKTRYCFMINIYPVMVRKSLERFAHPHRRIIEGGVVKIR